MTQTAINKNTRIGFVVDHRLVFEPLGIMQLSAILKNAGYTVRLFEKSSDIIAKIGAYQPHILCYSVITSSEQSYFDLNARLKSYFPSIISIFGGPYPTFNQDFFEDRLDIDALCVGEGDHALLDFVTAFEKKSDFYHTQNFHVRHNGAVIKNKMGNLVEDLDALPAVDRELIYGENVFLRNNSVKRFYVSRGCAFDCSFCFNHAYKALYQGKGHMCRERSVESVLSEIGHVKEKYLLECVKFIDDMISPRFWREFLPSYKKRIGLPFSCLMRPNIIASHPDIAALMKEAGCLYVAMGIESANDYIRNVILERNIERSDIEKAVSVLKGHNIGIMTLNMVGNPEETFAMALETLDMNRALRVDFAGCALFQPYKGTRLYDYALTKGYIDKTNTQGASLFNTSLLRFASLKEKRMIENLQKFFTFVCRNPSFCSFVVRALLPLPSNIFFNVFNRMYEYYVLSKMYKLRFSLRHLFRFVKNYLTFFQKA